MKKLTLVLEDELHERIVALAGVQRRSMSAQAVSLIEAAFARMDAVGAQTSGPTGLVRTTLTTAPPPEEPGPPAADGGASERVQGGRKGPRRNHCEHGLAPHQFCKRCDSEEAA